MAPKAPKVPKAVRNIIDEVTSKGLELTQENLEKHEISENDLKRLYSAMGYWLQQNKPEVKKNSYDKIVRDDERHVCCFEEAKNNTFKQIHTQTYVLRRGALKAEVAIPLHCGARGGWREHISAKLCHRQGQRHYDQSVVNAR